MDPAKSTRVLRIVLSLLALDAGFASILQLFAGRSLMTHLFPYLPTSEVTDLLLLNQRQSGALHVALTVMLIAAARNPRGNSLVVRAVTIGVVLASVAELVGIWTLHSGRLYPVTLTIAHALTRLGVAGLLMYLTVRGKATGAGPDSGEVAV